MELNEAGAERLRTPSSSDSGLDAEVSPVAGSSVRTCVPTATRLSWMLWTHRCDASDVVAIGLSA